MSRLTIDTGIIKYEGFVRFGKKPEVFRLDAVNSRTAKPISIVVYRNEYVKHGHNYEITALDFTPGQEPIMRFSLLSPSRLTRQIQANGQDPGTGKPNKTWVCSMKIR